MGSDKSQVRIGVIGAGHLGRFHIECIQRIEGFSLTGFHDVDPQRADEIASKYQVTPYKTPELLFEEVDAVCIVTPTITHYDLAIKSLEAGLHLFIEKPLTNDPATSYKLTELLREKNLVGRVGHVERYNPAFRAAQRLGIDKPVFVEAHRLAPFNVRGMDVPVVMDLMIHDIDVILSIIDSEVEHIEANGVGVAGRSADICNARITFKNKAVVNLTASRISLKQMRKLRLFQRDQYMSIDFLNQEVQIVKLLHEEPQDQLSMKLDLPEGARWIAAEAPEIEKGNAIEEELKEFFLAIQGQSTSGVSFEDGAKAVDIAHKIMEQIMAYEI